MSLLKDYWWILLIGFSAGGWAIAQEMGQKTLEQRTATIAAGVEQNQSIVSGLARLHEQQMAEEAGAEKGREETIREFCESGRITGNICHEE